MTRRLALTIAIYLGTFMVTLDISIVNLALPRMQQSLQTDMAGLQWIVDSYALCLSAFMLSAGLLGDRYGRKKSWLLGVLAFTVGSMMCALAGSLSALLWGRVVQGMAGALLIPGALSILTHAFPDPAQRARVIGGWSSFSALALVLGPILGGVLVDVADWPSIFSLNLPLGLLTLGLGMWGIQESANPEHAAFDPIGQLLSVIWLGSLTYGLICAGEQGWHATETVRSLGVAAATFVAFIYAQTRVARPLLPLSLFRDYRFSTANIASFVLGFAAYSNVFFLSLFFQNALGWSATQTGWGLAPQFIGMAVLASRFGALSQRFGLKMILTVGFGLMAAGSWLMMLLQPGASYWMAGFALAVLGIGMGLSVPACSTLVMNLVPRERSGMASATTNAIRQTGMTLGVALLASLMSQGAVSSLSSRLDPVNPMREQAQQIISSGQVNLPASADSLFWMQAIQHAWADGFHRVMFWAGLLAVFSLVLLLRLRLPRVQAAPAAAVELH